MTSNSVLPSLARKIRNLRKERREGRKELLTALARLLAARQARQGRKGGANAIPLPKTTTLDVLEAPPHGKAVGKTHAQRQKPAGKGA